MKLTIDRKSIQSFSPPPGQFMCYPPNLPRTPRHPIIFQGLTLVSLRGTTGLIIFIVVRSILRVNIFWDHVQVSYVWGRWQCNRGRANIVGRSISEVKGFRQQFFFGCFFWFWSLFPKGINWPAPKTWLVLRHSRTRACPLAKIYCERGWNLYQNRI